MIITFFGCGKYKYHVPICMVWVALGMFPIEAFAYVATSACVVFNSKGLFTDVICSFTIASTYSEMARIVMIMTCASKTIV
jgi:hypothetical protein